MKKIFSLFAIVALGLFIGNANAAVTATPVFPQAPKLGLQNFVQGTDNAGTYKTVYTGGSNGSKCTALIASSTDGSAGHLVTVQLKRSSDAYTTVAVTVPASSGNANGTPPVNLMSTANWVGLPFDSDGNPYIFLASASDTIQATFATALTSSTQVNIIAICSDF